MTISDAARVTQGSTAGMDLERLARIPAWLHSLVQEGRIPGAVTLVARHGAVASLEAVGYQDLETMRPMRTDTIFQIASMTKPVTAAAIMILLEEGRLHLTEPVKKYLPEFTGMLVSERREGDKERLFRPPSRAVTIYDLLTHTSGMRENMLLEPRPLDADTILQLTLAEHVAFAAQLPLEFEPDTQFQYSDEGFNTLGRIIEVVSGQPYEQFVDETIFRPLGMKDSFFFVPPDKRDRIATWYRLEEGKLKVYERRMRRLRPERKNPVPAAGMKSTASDLFAFYQMMLNGGAYNGRRILSQASVEEMTRVHASGMHRSLPASYGLGWFVRGERGPRQSLASIGAYFHGGGTSTAVLVDPKKEVVAVFLVQRERCEERNFFMAMAAAAVAD